MSNIAFCYTDERFADLQMLRYKLEGFENLTQRKEYIFIIFQRPLFVVEILQQTNTENTTSTFARCSRLYTFTQTDAMTHPNLEQ